MVTVLRTHDFCASFFFLSTVDNNTVLGPGFLVVGLCVIWGTTERHLLLRPPSLG